MNRTQAPDLEHLNRNILGPRVFIHIKKLLSLSLDFYIDAIIAWI